MLHVARLSKLSYRHTRLTAGDEARPLNNPRYFRLRRLEIALFSPHFSSDRGSLAHHSTTSSGHGGSTDRCGKRCSSASSLCFCLTGATRIRISTSRKTPRELRITSRKCVPFGGGNSMVTNDPQAIQHPSLLK